MTLTDRLPPAADPDALVEVFADWAFEEQGLSLYAAQEEALLELVVIGSAPRMWVAALAFTGIAVALAVRRRATLPSLVLGLACFLAIQPLSREINDNLYSCFFAILFLLLAYGYAIFVTLCALAVEEWAYHRHERWRDLGAIVVASKLRSRYDRDDQRLLEVIATVAGLAYASLRLLDAMPDAV